MEGTLWKWTNYYSGWQPRWFVLEDGNLSYYLSKEEVRNGCKGSLKLSVCDVAVHSTDPTRFDLGIPGEQHYHLKAASQQERQRWLIGLGSCKVGMSSDGLHIHTQPKEVSVPMEEIATKRSELRLYRDLILQQVASIHGCVAEGQLPDVERLDELSGMLLAASNTFMVTMDECMTLIHAQRKDNPAPSGPPSPAPYVSPTSPLSLASISSNPKEIGDFESDNRRRSVSSIGSTGRAFCSPPVSSLPGNGTLLWTDDVSVRHPPVTHLGADSEAVGAPLRPRTPRDRRQNHTFFSSMTVSFEDVRLGDNQNIPTATFLAAYRCLIPLFDRFNPTTFLSVKSDLNVNLKKIDLKYSSRPQDFLYLQHMMTSEVESGLHLDTNSATLATLTLNRTLEFITDLLGDISKGSSNGEDLNEVASSAYSRTLKQHHPWVLRGVYALAVKSLPARSQLLLSLCHHNTDLDQLDLDLRRQCQAISQISAILREFFLRSVPMPDSAIRPSDPSNLPTSLSS